MVKTKNRIVFRNETKKHLKEKKRHTKKQRGGLVTQSSYTLYKSPDVNTIQINANRIKPNMYFIKEANETMLESDKVFKNKKEIIDILSNNPDRKVYNVYHCKNDDCFKFAQTNHNNEIDKQNQKNNEKKSVQETGVQQGQGQGEVQGTVVSTGQPISGQGVQGTVVQPGQGQGVQGTVVSTGPPTSVQGQGQGVQGTVVQPAKVPQQQQQQQQQQQPQPQPQPQPVEKSQTPYQELEKDIDQELEQDGYSMKLMDLIITDELVTKMFPPSLFSFQWWKNIFPGKKEEYKLDLLKDKFGGGWKEKSRILKKHKQYIKKHIDKGYCKLVQTIYYLHQTKIRFTEFPSDKKRFSLLLGGDNYILQIFQFMNNIDRAIYKKDEGTIASKLGKGILYAGTSLYVTAALTDTITGVGTAGATLATGATTTGAALATGATAIGSAFVSASNNLANAQIFNAPLESLSPVSNTFTEAINSVGTSGPGIENLWATQISYMQQAINKLKTINAEGGEIAGDSITNIAPEIASGVPVTDMTGLATTEFFTEANMAAIAADLGVSPEALALSLPGMFSEGAIAAGGAGVSLATGVVLESLITAAVAASAFAAANVLVILPAVMISLIYARYQWKLSSASSQGLTRKHYDNIVEYMLTDPNREENRFLKINKLVFDNNTSEYTKSFLNEKPPTVSMLMELELDTLKELRQKIFTLAWDTKHSELTVDFDVKGSYVKPLWTSVDEKITEDLFKKENVNEIVDDLLKMVNVSTVAEDEIVSNAVKETKEEQNKNKTGGKRKHKNKKIRVKKEFRI